MAALSLKLVSFFSGAFKYGKCIPNGLLVQQPNF